MYTHVAQRQQIQGLSNLSRNMRCTNSTFSFSYISFLNLLHPQFIYCKLKRTKGTKKKNKEKIFLDWLVFVLHSLSELRVQYINSCLDDSHYSKQYLTIF